MKKLLNITSFLLCILILSVFAIPAYSIDAASDENFIEVKELQQQNTTTYDNAKPQEINKEKPEYILKTNQGEIPIYVSEDLAAGNGVEQSYLQVFLNEAISNQPVNEKIQTKNLSTAAEAYEFVCVEDKQTYSFYNDPKGNTSIEIFPTDKVTVNSTTHLNPEKNIVSLKAYKGSLPIFSRQERLLAATTVDLDKGIGARAITSTSAASCITATLKSDAPYYSSSVPDNGYKDPVSINFYNYVGFTVSTLATDLGLQWSNTYQGWKMYGLVSDGGTTYTLESTTVTSSNGTNVYKATTNYPATITAEKYYVYNGNNRLRLTINGTLTNMNTGTSVLIMPRGTTSSVTYKVLTTVTSSAESNIKKDTSISSNYSSIKLDSATVSSFYDLQIDNATLTYSSSLLSATVRKK